MKKQTSIIPFTLIIITLLSCSQTQEKFIKLEQSEVDQEKVELATHIVTEFFNLLKSGETFDFSKNSSREFLDQMSPEIQKKAYKQLKTNFGEFKSVTFIETWVKRDTKDYQIIRMKGNFENSLAPLEIRITFDETKKVIGFWITPWIDNLNKT